MNFLYINFLFFYISVSKKEVIRVMLIIIYFTLPGKLGKQYLMGHMLIKTRAEIAIENFFSFNDQVYKQI